MSIDIMTCQPKGDKKNSEFFDEYRAKIFERRIASGLNDLIEHVRAIVIQVCPGDGVDYLAELTLMGPYRYCASYRSETHNIYLMSVDPKQPCILVLEPLDPNYSDDVTSRNNLYPRGAEKSNARYLGELFKTRDAKETVDILRSHDIRFETAHSVKNPFFMNSHFHFTVPSYFTTNRVGYTHADLLDFDNLNIGTRFELSGAEKETLDAAEDKHNGLGIKGLTLGIDHMATRIFAGEREDAILEFLTLSNYYFWGAYNIGAMNSSTNVTRHPNIDTDLHSPAKVFTANNTPYFVNSLSDMPMPTEDFVRNFGKRMHHMAYEVKDGDHVSGGKNIDYVVAQLKEAGVPFLAHVFGACENEPDLKQIFSQTSKLSILISEYVERCHGFDGFFTKANVADLTAAAGLAEGLNTFKDHGPLGD
jgi:hypothetical protein